MRILSFFIGLLFSLQGSVSIYVLLVFLCFLLFEIYRLFRKLPAKFFSTQISVCVLLFLAGYLWGELNFYYHLQGVFPAEFEGKNIVVEGRVEGVPVNSPHAQEFQLDVDKINNQVWKGKISLYWYKNKYAKPVPERNQSSSKSRKNKCEVSILKPGEKWRFSVKLKRPHGFRNPGSFDYDAWLFEQNIQARGYVTKAHCLLEKSEWHDWIDQCRQKIGDKWQAFSKQWPLLGIMMAFTVGLTGDITPDQWQVFTNTGTIHLISISGFHINLMAGMAYGIVSFLWRRVTFLCARWPAQRAAAVGAILFGIIYSLMAGASIPTQRSCIMLTIFMGGVLFLRQTRLWQCFWWSILIIVLWDPFAPLNLSFWLTYGAVGIILYVINDKPIQDKKSFFSVKNCLESLKLQGKIFLGLLPFSLFWFSQVSCSSLWANLVAIPVTGFLILPLGLVSIFLEGIYFPAAVFLMQIAHWVLENLYAYLSWISHTHPIIFVCSLSDIGVLLLGILGVLVLLAPRGFPARWLGLLFLLPLFFPIKNSINYGEANFSLLDVGQGLASVIQTKNHVLVFDTGPKFSEYFDTGQAVVLPYLRHQHITHIDALVISHKDLDHSGGLGSILTHIPVDKIWVNDRHVLKTARLCKPNVKWTWDGVTFEFLTQGLAQFTNTNDTCCVLKVSNGKQSLLLPGDLETRAEKVLVNHYGEHLKADVLVAGHHGSKTSSSMAWLNAVQPKFSLFATGYLNRYHFPNKNIVERYEKMNVRHWSSADCGMIEWRLSKKNTVAEPTCYVKKYLSPWLLP